ncbi:exodeoxyribonuclease VII small subunit [Curvibacter sp. CHRR-16]|uniref:exodeoxyribonuclease VII small subunit n=1 Tax=Curvibacter sp. CHRR-16 TaxID=2835872 RepID=UPI001BD9219B|nr:exodeoxyribonuclease VII small subunit [Curvibacter sp. CHRR-16]MBT0570790.1 exodeoxyribonuclease VII small subunit [Curvibacter sp. CHRR-16]
MSKVKANAADSATAAADVPERYEDALHALEDLVARMESGDMPLDELLGAYQRGAALLERCRSQLQTLDEQIQVLENGVLKSWKS